MNVTELDRALRQLRLSGMADVLEARLRHALTERLSPLDFVATLVSSPLRLAGQVFTGVSVIGIQEGERKLTRRRQTRGEAQGVRPRSDLSADTIACRSAARVPC